jgi:hypothetical protein
MDILHCRVGFRDELGGSARQPSHLAVSAAADLEREAPPDPTA